MASFVPEILPPILEPTAEPPPLFDGTIRWTINVLIAILESKGNNIDEGNGLVDMSANWSWERIDLFYDARLYVNYECPFCQRVWIVRNIKGLQDKIKLVAIHLQDKPLWFKEKVYPENKVPALEHNGKVFGESLDLIKYIDSSFEGPSLLPNDPSKLNLAEEMISYLDAFLKKVFGSFRGIQPAEEAGGEFDYLEKSLEKFDDGPFFLGQFSQVDAAYVPFIERFQIFLLEVWNYDITSGRPKLAAYIQELNKIGAYKHTKCDPEFLVKLYKSRYMAHMHTFPPPIIPSDIPSTSQRRDTPPIPSPGISCDDIFRSLPTPTPAGPYDRIFKHFERLESRFSSLETTMDRQHSETTSSLTRLHSRVDSLETEMRRYHASRDDDS